MRKPDIKKLQKQCDDFNAVCPVGALIMFKRDGVEEPYEAVTRSEAYILSGHSAVVFVRGITGCYSLNHCEPITEEMPAYLASEKILARLGNHTRK